MVATHVAANYDATKIAPLLLLIEKGHACCGYALVNAGITPSLRYQPFSGCTPSA